MSNAWDIAKQMAERHTSSIFVRLTNDGDKVVGIFVGEPLSREVVWTGEKYLDVKNPEAEKYLKKGRYSSLRVAMNLYIPAEKAVKVYEMGAVVFKDVFKLREKYGLDTWAFEIERHGGKGDSKTSYSILPEQRLDDAMRRQIAQLELHDLEKVLSNTDAGGDEEQSFDSYENKQDASIDGTVVEQMLLVEPPDATTSTPRCSDDASYSPAVPLAAGLLLLARRASFPLRRCPLTLGARPRMSPLSLTRAQISVLLLVAQRAAEPLDRCSDLASRFDTPRAYFRVEMAPVELLAQRLDPALVPVKCQIARTILRVALKRVEEGCEDSLVPDTEGVQDPFQIHQIIAIRALGMRLQHGLECSGSHRRQGLDGFFGQEIAMVLISERCQQRGDCLARTELAEEDGSMDGRPSSSSAYVE